MNTDFTVTFTLPFMVKFTLPFTTLVHVSRHPDLWVRMSVKVREDKKGLKALLSLRKKVIEAVTKKRNSYS